MIEIQAQDGTLALLHLWQLSIVEVVLEDIARDCKGDTVSEGDRSTSEMS